VTAALLAPLPAAATTLDYDAYLGGKKVGGAEVVIERADDHYRIQGKAWAEGFFRWLTQWRTHFSAMGRFVEGSPIGEAYSLIEQAKDKMKEISLENGEVTYVKNGKAKQTPAPSSKLDFITALFLPTSDCDASYQLHSGRDEYSVRLTRRQAITSDSGASLRCDFEVRDQNDERIEASVWLGEIDGVTVPVRLDLKGAVEGTLKLRA
jgi:hypothetical protein